MVSTNTEDIAAQMAHEHARLKNAWLQIWCGILYPGKKPEELVGKFQQVVRTNRPNRTELWRGEEFIAFLELTPNFTTPQKQQ